MPIFAEDKNFLVYAPEVIIYELECAQPVSGELLWEWGARRFNDLEEFISDSKPGDVITTKDITVIRIGKVFT